jgi:hypothetical protein
VRDELAQSWLRIRSPLVKSPGELRFAGVFSFFILLGDRSINTVGPSLWKRRQRLRVTMWQVCQGVGAPSFPLRGLALNLNLMDFDATPINRYLCGETLHLSRNFVLPLQRTYYKPDTLCDIAVARLNNENPSEGFTYCPNTP